MSYSDTVTVLYSHWDNSNFYSWRGQGVDGKTGHDDHEREGESARPQPASARQVGGAVSQKPPWGLALMLRGSMSAVPSSAGMRASMHSGTGPHSCRLFCVANPRSRAGRHTGIARSDQPRSLHVGRPRAAAGCLVQPSRLAMSQIAPEIHGHASREVHTWHMDRVRFLGGSECVRSDVSILSSIAPDRRHRHGNRSETAFVTRSKLGSPRGSPERGRTPAGCRWRHTGAPDRRHRGPGTANFSSGALELTQV